MVEAKKVSEENNDFFYKKQKKQKKNKHVVFVARHNQDLFPIYKYHQM